MLGYNRKKQNKMRYQKFFFINNYNYNYNYNFEILNYYNAVFNVSVKRFNFLYIMMINNISNFKIYIAKSICIKQMYKF